MKRRVRGYCLYKAISSKEATAGQWGHNLNFILDILELMMTSEKKALSGFNGSVLRNIVLRNIIGGYSFFNFFKEGLLK